MMNGFMQLAGKLSSNRYLSAIRDGFVFAMPLTIAASFAVLINNVLLANNLPFALTNPEYYGAEFISVVEKIKFIFTSIEFGGLQWITAIVVFGIAFTLAEMSNVKKPMTNAIIIFATFVVLLPKGELIAGGIWAGAGGEGYEAAVAAGLGTTSLSQLFSGSNLFTALVVGILFSELLIKFQSFDKLIITLPDQVPPAVANSFSALIPAFLTFLVAGILATLLMVFKPLGYGDLSALISGVVQQPFLALAKTGAGGTVLIVVYAFFANFLWVFGLHGPNILSGFATPTLGTLSLENQSLYAQTGDAYAPELAVFTMGFIDAYTQYGGSGATLGLLISIFLVSKRDDYRAIAKLSLAPGLFEINEPIVFGMPIVLNPILGVPFVLAPLVSLIVPGILTTIGVLPKVVIAVPWVMPPVINAFLATGANWKAALVGIVNIVLITLVYLPFVLIANKQAEAEANASVVE